MARDMPNRDPDGRIHIHVFRDDGEHKVANVIVKAGWEGDAFGKVIGSSPESEESWEALMELVEEHVETAAGFTRPRG